MEENIFEKLFKINVNDKIETKNGLNYLSWAYAWAEIKKIYPTANYKVYETESGCIYHTDGKTCWVKTGVTINDLEHIEYLPVMDFRNKSIPVNNVTSFDVNKTIQRSLTKAVARHGLGLYIYAGEDLPENETPPEKGKEQPKKEQKQEQPLSNSTGAKLNQTLIKYSKLSGKEPADISKDLVKLVNKPLKSISEAEGQFILEILKGKISKYNET